MSLLIYNSRRQVIASLHDTFSFSDFSFKQQFLARTLVNSDIVSDSPVVHRLYTKSISEPSFYSDSLLNNEIHFYNATDSFVESDVAQRLQIHVRNLSDQYQSIDELTYYGIHFINNVDNELTIDVGLATQIITGLGVTEELLMSDSVQFYFGKPVPIVPLPGTGDNFSYVVPSPLNFPRIPLYGYSLGFNVSLGEISLVQNNIGSSGFQTGLYVFYNKNNSVWYRFKTNSLNNLFGETWSEEYLLYSGLGQVTNETNFTGDVGVQDSTTIFDSNGYPVTAFINSNGNIGVQYFVSGNPVVLNSQLVGSSLNLIVIGGTIILMWIPENYVDTLYFSSSDAAFQAACPYYVGIPGALQSFSLTQKDEIDWVFSFTTMLNGVNHVYYAST
jgi:hypothetical protein